MARTLWQWEHSAQCSMDRLGSPSPGGGQRASEEVLQQCPHVALRAKPAGLLSWALRWQKVGRRAGGKENWAPVHHLLSSAGRWMLGERRHVYATDLLPVVSTPLKCWETPACTPGSCGPRKEI